MILAGDIGGTKSLLAFFSRDAGPRQPHGERSLPSRSYAGLAEVLKDFLRGADEPVELACFGVPGPVIAGRSETPNIPWGVVDTRELREVIGSEVILLNDLEATGYGVETLGDQEIETLSQGLPNPQGNAALIAPGTGLGEAILFWDGQQRRPSASEGGHADFSPRNPQEIELLHYLLKDFDRVSWDRILSGRGLRDLYRFLRDTDLAEEPGWLAEEMARANDPAVAISQRALDTSSELCVKTLDLWVTLLGAEASNLALKALATAGVYLAGGIAPKIRAKLRDRTFLESFHAKGRLSAVVKQMPVHLVVDEKVGLYGAARFAFEKTQAPR
ncbi:MAG: glucokinase [Candidatus Acidiferrales bacterium]